jgi:hypothetical protein
MELLKCLILLFVLSVAITGSQNNVYSNTWAVHITNGETTANNLARKYGFRNLGQVIIFLSNIMLISVIKERNSSICHVSCTSVSDIADNARHIFI